MQHEPEHGHSTAFSVQRRGIQSMLNRTSIAEESINTQRTTTPQIKLPNENTYLSLG